MTRILSYNILYGGTERVNELAKIIKSTNADVVGLVEATDPQVVEELAERLGMHYAMSGRAKHKRDWQAAVLSRLPIVYSQGYVRPGILTRTLLEVWVEEPGGQQLSLFITHLTAAFRQLRAGDYIRRREVQEVLRIAASKHGKPHIIMGDFNALAPGDQLQASMLLRRLIEMDRRRKYSSGPYSGQPNLDFVVPIYLCILKPLLYIIPRSKLLSTLFDAVVACYAPRGSVGLMGSAGYVDCFRCMSPHELGFTCPAASPAGRIDFIFASPELAPRLSASQVVTEGEGLRGDAASDHFSLWAEFRD